MRLQTRIIGGRCIAFGVLLAATTLQAQTGTRTLRGTVSDRQHEPLKGAVVQVQDEATGIVVTYIADKTGSYSFKRLLGSDDYKVWATYRGQRSKSKEMSHFDSKPNKTLLLTIKLN